MSSFFPSFLTARAEWSRYALRWLRLNRKMTRADIASGIGLRAASLGNMVYQDPPQWFLEYLAVLATGWKPSRDWTACEDLDRQEAVDQAIGRLNMSAEDFDRWFPIGSPPWRDKIYEGSQATPIPVRLAVVADMINSGAAPCGVPFETWSA